MHIEFSKSRIAQTIMFVAAIGFSAQAVFAQESAARPKPVTADYIVAVVNDGVITYNELLIRIADVEARIRTSGGNPPPRSEMQKQLLERLILERAELQLASDDGIRVDDLALDRAIASIAESNKLTVNQLRDQVEKDGTPYSRFREEIRSQIIFNRLQTHEVDSKIKITDAEIDNLIEQEKNAAQAPEELELAQILIAVPENATPEQIAARRKKAEDVLNQLKAGADFSNVALSTSDGMDASKGGRLDWRAKNRLPQLFVDAVANLKQGEISGVVKSANGFHIIKVLGRRGGGTGGIAALAQTSVVKTHARHIIIKVNQVVTAAEAKRKLIDLRTRLENKAATFEDLAKLYSNDGSAAKGGDLGWLSQGDTVPEFEKAMDALKENEISEPIETQFGYHLIQVLERKKDDVSKEHQRAVARQVLQERKRDEAVEEWLRTIRDRAYVEYHLDEK